MSKSSSKENSGAFEGFLRYFYGNFVVLILGFVSIPLITRVMSRAEYGRTGMFTTAVTVIYIFAILGMDQSYIRHYYKEGIDRRRLLKNCLLPSLILVIALCIVYIAFSGMANRFLFERTGADITALVVAYTITSVFERFLFLDIRMSQNGKLYSNLNILSKVLYISMIFLFVKIYGDDFRVVLWAMTLSLGIVTGFIGIRYLYINRGKAGADSVSVGGRNGEDSYTELLKYGLPFILVLLMEWLLSSCDRWALRIWSGYEELGIYNSAMNIMSVLLTFKATFVAFWSPVAMEKYESREQDTKDFFRKAFCITRFFCILAGIGLILFKDAIVFILGEDYRLASRVIPFLTLMPVFSILFEITNQGIKFKKKNRYLNYASMAAIVCNIAGNAILVPRFGGAGAAMATGITYMAYFVIGSIFSEKCYKVGYENKKTVLYGIMLLAYALVGTYMEGYLISAAVGIIFIISLVILDAGIVRECIGFMLEKLRLLKSGGKK